MLGNIINSWAVFRRTTYDLGMRIGYRYFEKKKEEEINRKDTLQKQKARNYCEYYLGDWYYAIRFDHLRLLRGVYSVYSF